MLVRPPVGLHLSPRGGYVCSDIPGLAVNHHWRWSDAIWSHGQFAFCQGHFRMPLWWLRIFFFSSPQSKEKTVSPFHVKQASKQASLTRRPADQPSGAASKQAEISKAASGKETLSLAVQQQSRFPMPGAVCRRPPLHGHREAATSLDPGPTPSPSPLLGALPDSISQFKRSWGEGEVRLAWQAEHVCEASPICHVLPGLFCREGGRRKECEWAKLQATMQVT